MQRFLYVKNGIVINIVGYTDDVVPPLLSPDGESIVPDPTGMISVGDLFDPKPIQATSIVAALDSVIVGELLRLSNRIAILELKPTQTMPEYLAALAQQYTPVPKGG